MRKVMIVVLVLITSCQVSDVLNKRRENAQTTMDSVAMTNAQGDPMAAAATCENF